MTSWDITFIRYLHFLYSANIVAIFLFQYFPSMMAPASVLLWLSISRGFANAHTSLRCPWSWWWLSGWWWWLGEHNWGWKPWWIACANTARWRCLVGFYPSNEVSSPETGSTWATSASADRRWTCTEISRFQIWLDFCQIFNTVNSNRVLFWPERALWDCSRWYCLSFRTAPNCSSSSSGTWQRNHDILFRRHIDFYSCKAI